MTDRAKSICRNAIEHYKVAENKTHLVNGVKEQLKEHNKSVDTIGLGLDEDMVSAAKVFLRII